MALRGARQGDPELPHPASTGPSAAASGSTTSRSAARRPSAGSPGSASTAARAPTGPSVELVHVDGTEDDLLAASLYEATGVAEAEIRNRLEHLDPIERDQLLADLVGARDNRRHRPGRGWETVRYRFEIVSDYGGFRDMQRHRMLNCQWQTLGPDLGAGVPEEVDEAGCGDEYERALDISRTEFERLEAAGMDAAAPYALCLGYRIRYVLDMNAREAMHVCELRSGREGHPTYRAVAQAMHERIADGPPADRRRDAPRRLELRAAPGADHERDPHAQEASRGRGR